MNKDLANWIVSIILAIGITLIAIKSIPIALGIIFFHSVYVLEKK